MKVSYDNWLPVQETIVLLYYDVKTFIKILLFNTRDDGQFVGAKQRKYTENMI